MRFILALAFIFGLSVLPASAQIVKDPLLAYYEAFDQPLKLPPETQVYSFAANLTSDGRKAIFITNDLARLGPAGQYAWSLYYPLKDGGYKVASDESHFIVAGLDGPNYIGYIDQIKRYGVVVGFKDGVEAQYVEDGTIKDKMIAKGSDLANAGNYPKYFSDSPPVYHISTYTLDQLRQKYDNSDTGNSGPHTERND
jgi:hypothetical protein